MSHRSRWEYFKAIYARYRRASRQVKQAILSEFCANTRYNRKYAIRLLNGPPPGQVQARTRRPVRLPMALGWCRCWRRCGRRPAAPGRSV